MHSCVAFACAWLLLSSLLSAFSLHGVSGEVVLRQSLDQVFAKGGAGILEQCSITPEIESQKFQCLDCIYEDKLCPDNCCVTVLDLGGGTHNVENRQFLACAIGGCCTRIVNNGNRSEIFIADNFSPSGKGSDTDPDTCLNFKLKKDCPLCANPYKKRLLMSCDAGVAVPARNEALGEIECRSFKSPSDEVAVSEEGLENVEEDEDKNKVEAEDEKADEAALSNENEAKTEDKEKATSEKLSEDDDDDESNDDEDDKASTMSKGDADTNSLEEHGKGVNIGAIVGITLACIGALLLLLAFLLCPCQAFKRKILWGAAIGPLDPKFSVSKNDPASLKRSEFEVQHDGARPEGTGHSRGPLVAANKDGLMPGADGEVAASDLVMSSDSSNGSDYGELNEIIPHSWDASSENSLEPVLAEAGRASPPNKETAWKERLPEESTDFAELPMPPVTKFLDEIVQKDDHSLAEEEPTEASAAPVHPMVSAFPAGNDIDPNNISWPSSVQPISAQQPISSSIQPIEHDESFGDISDYSLQPISIDRNFDRQLPSASRLPTEPSDTEIGLPMDSTRRDSLLMSDEECSVTPHPGDIGRMLAQSAGNSAEFDDTNYYF